MRYDSAQIARLGENLPLFNTQVLEFLYFESASLK